MSAEESPKTRKFTLLTGRQMPQVGFGTFRLESMYLQTAVDTALDVGYRLFDTAAVYGNETELGLTFKEYLPSYDLTREDIFITSKLSPSDHGERARDAAAASIRRLDCGYLDLYLIHWPGAGGVHTSSPQNKQFRAASWRSLIRARDEGLVRDIGVSNYTTGHLEELLQNCEGVKPVVNQVEWHPGCVDPELKQLCDREGIILQAYSSLGGTGNRELLTDPAVVEIAKRIQKTAAQVLLRWAIQQNLAIIPKAMTPSRVDQNIELDFTLDEKDMQTLNNFDEKRFAWNPHTIK